jgi:hypothetical protein
VQRLPKWKDGPSTPTPTKQSTLDDLFGCPTMSRKSTKAKIEVQSTQDGHLNGHDSVETGTPSTRPTAKKNKLEEKGVMSSSTKKNHSKPELELSPTRRSPRILAQKSKLIPKSPKYSMPLVESPPLPIRSDTRPFPSLSPAPPILTPSLSIAKREGHHPASRSPSEFTQSYHTALLSPIRSSRESFPSEESVMDAREEENTTENKSSDTHKEIPSSLPWENSPSDGIGDAWPSSQSSSFSPKASQSRSIQRSQPRYDNGFRVPDPPSSRVSLDDTQDESFASPSLEHSQSKHASQPRHDATHCTPGRLNSSQAGLDDTQDESQPSALQHSLSTRQPTAFHVAQTVSKGNLDDTQDLTQDSEHDIPRARKRKREISVIEIPDSAPLDDKVEIEPLDNSCIILSQTPPSMRKKTPEVINIHSTQSQTQEYIPAPGPRPTSQDLSKPFGRSSTNSSSSSAHQASHNWESSQVTQSPVESLPELSSVTNPPSQLQLSSQNDLSRIPVPLGMTLEYGFPSRGFSDLPDLDKMEEEQELRLKKWEKHTPKPKYK